MYIVPLHSLLLLLVAAKTPVNYLFAQIRRLVRSIRSATVTEPIQVQVRVDRNVILHLHLVPRVATQSHARPFLGRLYTETRRHPRTSTIRNKKQIGRLISVLSNPDNNAVSSSSAYTSRTYSGL